MQIKKALDLVEAKTKLNMEYFQEQFPSAITYNDYYKKVNNADWTEGFWTGILWMMYEYSKDESFKTLAKKNVASFQKRMDHNIVLDHHDMGFLFQLSAVADYKITADPKSYKLGIQAADKLLSRWQAKPGFIQAWGSMDDETEHRFIIDSLLNLPLLYWASEASGDLRYAKHADQHFKICLKYLIRENGSSYHTYYVDPKSHQPSHGLTKQGYSDDSSWARGQAWAIYGIALNYRHHPNQSSMDKFIQVTDYFLKHLPKDQVVYWDLIFSDGSKHPKDSGSNAIAICGILEMLSYIEDEAIKARYKQASEAMMSGLLSSYANQKLEGGTALLDEGVYSWHEGYGIEEGNLWGDYFYVEALMRMYNREWKPYW